MTKTYLGNAFSLQMLDTAMTHNLVVTPVSIEEVASSNFMSVVGHPDTAAVMQSMLGAPVEYNRCSVHLETGDTLYVGQLTGGRLPEGATTLPDGFSICFLKVEVN